MTYKCYGVPEKDMRRLERLMVARLISSEQLNAWLDENDPFDTPIDGTIFSLTLDKNVDELLRLGDFSDYDEKLMSDKERFPPSITTPTEISYMIFPPEQVLGNRQYYTSREKTAEFLKKKGARFAHMDEALLPFVVDKKLGLQGGGGVEVYLPTMWGGIAISKYDRGDGRQIRSFCDANCYRSGYLLAVYDPSNC